jgi:hypothetical protein
VAAVVQLRQSNSPYRRHEVAVVAALSLFAALRIFLSAAALPCCTNVDEDPHYDVVHKYARGYRPTAGSDRFDEEAARGFLLYCSPEFVSRGDEFPNGIPKPLWTASRSTQEYSIAQRLQTYQVVPNHEAFSPPVYYTVAAGWLRAGRILGLDGPNLFYWVRFLDSLIYPALIVLSYCFIRRFYPHQPALRFQVPLLLTFFPQDIFFSISNDVLSPLAFLGALYLLFAWMERGTYRLAIAAGFMTATTMLVKFSNVAVLVVLGLVLARQVWPTRRIGAARPMGEVLSVIASAAAPIAAWLIRSRVSLGDFFGSAKKIADLGWTQKPVGQIFNHPLFTPRGIYDFWSELLARFWRGEVVWHLQQLVPAAADQFFIWVSTLFLAAAAVRWWRSRRPSAPTETRLDGYLLVAFAASVLFLMVLSLQFDFGFSLYPSRDRPYFTSGRLMLGALVPFLIVLVRGIEFACSKWAPQRGPKWVVAAIAVVSFLAPLNLLLSAASSEYNWFHLP